ncbi:MAG: hypothetical protein KGO49_04260 [Gammaproteobacteria bacterium]|nr:hypothetical protein [Gammaproteobacteria bacterium]
MGQYMGWGNFYVALVCGGETICLLTDSDLKEVIDVDSEGEQQWIAVSFESGTNMQVKGTKGVLKRKIPHNSFPKNIFNPPTDIEEVYLWPPLSKIKLYEGNPSLICSIEDDRNFDISDAFENYFDLDVCVDICGVVTAYISISSLSRDWDTWSEERLTEIEDKFKYTFNFEGYHIDIERVTRCSRFGHIINCEEDFIWRLEISRVKEDEDEEQDPLYEDALAFVQETNKVSASAIQRKFSIGYNRAAHIVDKLESAGMVSAMNSNGRREVYQK